MSVQPALSKQAHSLEFVLAIEGIGWPDSIDDLDGDWDGTVFATADLSGDMASTLGCTIKKCLVAPGGFSESFDPEGYTMTSGGMTFELVNSRDILSTYFRSHRNTKASGSEQAGRVYSGNVLDWAQTTLRIQWTNPGGTVTPAAAGDVVWVGGSEAVLLGSRSSLGSDAYEYASCTRGYLGTPRGTEDRPAMTGTSYGSEYAEGTFVYPWNPYWQGRRTLLCARIPGTDQLSALAHGLISKVTREKNGSNWSLQTVARSAPLRMRRKPVVGGGLVARDALLAVNDNARSYADAIYQDGGGDASVSAGQLRKRYVLVDLSQAVDSKTRFGSFLYAYRTVPGGTQGAYDSHFTTTPQAEQVTYTSEFGDDSGRYMSWRPALIGQNLTRILFKSPNAAGDEATSRHVVVERQLEEWGGKAWVTLSTDYTAEVRVLIDNYSATPEFNPFSVNSRVLNDPISFCLTLLTSRDGEFYRADAAAAGTTTTVNFTAPGWATDQWEGYALHCVEGANKGQARLILANDSDTLTVKPAFPSSSHNGNEYQIRNSIYDTLPFGFGMQVHNSEIDIQAWEDVRDKFGSLWRIGTVLIGADEDEDLWDLMQTQVFRVFGCIPYIDRSTGKMSLRYVGDTYPDGLHITYPSIDNDTVQPGSFKTVDLTPRPDISRLSCRYRGNVVIAARPVVGRVNILAATGAAEYGITRWEPLALAQDLTGESESTITVVIDELDRILRGTGREPTFEAMLCGAREAAMLRAIMVDRLYSIAVAAPEADLILDFRNLLELYAGAIIKVNCTNAGIGDPYSADTTLASHLCRILSMDVSVTPRPQVRMRVQMLGNTSTRAGLLAPACIVTAKGTMPDDNFEIGDNNVFVSATSADLDDWDGLVVGDRIELRDTTGALKEGPFVIASFGANEAATTELASTDIINVTSSISSTIAAGDYVTFAPWSSSNTSNMNNFCAYADATDEELGTGDSPKVWG